MHADRELHVIAFDIPFPADYGGVIDVYYKLKALHAAGVKVHLHCFENHRAQRQELNGICATVHYYPRLANRLLLLDRLPYIVCSRESQALRKQLISDDLPILMEGLHTTFLLNDPAFFHRKIFVRTHNVEHDYYRALGEVERKWLKRRYFFREAGKLERYEHVLHRASGIAAISPKDESYFNRKYGKTIYLPAFHPFDRPEYGSACEDFAFYHGNLSIGENDQAALFLVENVFNELPFRLVIAGSNPSRQLRSAVSHHPNVTIVEGVSPEEIHRYIARARVNVLPTFQSTGIKLKLLASLFLGRHCLVNPPMVEDTGLESLCLIAADATAFREQLRAIMDGLPFGEPEMMKRKEILAERFSNRKNAELLIRQIFN